MNLVCFLEDFQLSAVVLKIFSDSSELKNIKVRTEFSRIENLTKNCRVLERVNEQESPPTDRLRRSDSGLRLEFKSFWLSDSAGR